MKKIFLVLFALITVLAMFGCKGDDGRKSIVFWHTMGKTTSPEQGGQALVDQFITEFEAAYPEYKNEYKIVHEAKGGYTELNTAIGRAIPAGQEPHLAYCYPDHVAGYLRTNRVQPLNDLIADATIGLTSAEIDDYVPAFWAEGSVYGDDTIYNLPFSKSTEVMFYNKTFFAKNNLTMPAEPTWENILDLCQKIKAIAPSSTPFGYDSEGNLFITASHQLGINYTANGATLADQIKFNNDEAKKMVNYFNDTFINPGYMTTKGVLGGVYTSDEFRAGRLFMSVSSTGGTKYNVPSSSDAGGEFEVGVVPAPRFGTNIIDSSRTLNPAFIQQGPSITMFKKSNAKEVEVAWQFLKFITAPEQSARFSVPSGYSPVRISSYQTAPMKKLFENAQTGTAQEKLTASVLNLTDTLSDKFFTSPAFPKSATTRQAVEQLMIDVFTDARSVDNAFSFAYSFVTE